MSPEIYWDNSCILLYFLDFFSATPKNKKLQVKKSSKFNFFPQISTETQFSSHFSKNKMRFFLGKSNLSSIHIFIFLAFIFKKSFLVANKKFFPGSWFKFHIRDFNLWGKVWGENSFLLNFSGLFFEIYFQMVKLIIL